MKNALSKLFEFLGKANSERAGEPSSMRVNVFYAIIQWVPAVTFSFIWVTVTYPDLILAFLGVLMAGLLGLLGLKGWQKGKENDGTN